MRIQSTNEAEKRRLQLANSMVCNRTGSTDGVTDGGVGRRDELLGGHQPPGCVDGECRQYGQLQLYE
jgi:hypothetical protein